MSALGQSLRSFSASGPIFVCCYSKSDQKWCVAANDVPGGGMSTGPGGGLSTGQAAASPWGLVADYQWHLVGDNKRRCAVAVRP
jgi:hypothetical protein